MSEFKTGEGHEVLMYVTPLKYSESRPSCHSFGTCGGHTHALSIAEVHTRTNAAQIALGRIHSITLNSLRLDKPTAVSRVANCWR